MTFTFDLDNPTDREWIRIEIGDTVEAGALFSDELINYVLVDKGSKEQAVISLLEAKIAEIANQEDFKADWLQVSSSDNQLAALKSLLTRKEHEYGLDASTTSVTHRYRVDSWQKEEPDYSDDWE